MFYAYNGLARNEFTGGAFEDELVSGLNDLSILENILALLAIYSFLRILGYLFLHYLRGPKFLKF